MTIPQKLVIGRFSSGLQINPKPFFIDNDSFPVLENALCYRESVIKKPGSKYFGRLTRAILNAYISNISLIFNFNLLTDPSTNLVAKFPNCSLKPGTIVITIFSNVWNDKTTPGVLTQVQGTPPFYNGTVNYSTGECYIGVISMLDIVAAGFSYFVSLPVMGIQLFSPNNFSSSVLSASTTIFFDTMFSYQRSSSSFFDVTYYKNTAAPFNWNGNDYNQFSSCNYYKCLFVTNGNSGFHAKTIISAASTSGNTASISILNHSVPSSLVNLASIFIWQVQGFASINGQTGVITAVPDANTLLVSFPLANFPLNSTGLGGVAQYLNIPTNDLQDTTDGIRWFDGAGVSSLGWINFSPPLDNLNSIASTYLIGCKILISFANRLLAIGTFEGNFQTGFVFYANRIRYCQVNASPFYSSVTPQFSGGAFEPLAWADNIQGYGGFLDLDSSEPINSASILQGSLILCLQTESRKLSDTGTETAPFYVEVINPEFGAFNNASAIATDGGVVHAGPRGWVITSTYDAKRFDEKILDQTFSINTNTNNDQRITAIRDFQHECIYFSYVNDQGNTSFPNVTLVFNYNSNLDKEYNFALWNETVTCYGNFINQNKMFWIDMTDPWQNYDTILWPQWGAASSSEPLILFGNSQGFVMQRWAETSINGPSMYIGAVSSSQDMQASITSNNHNLTQGSYIAFYDANNSYQFSAVVQTVEQSTFLCTIFNASASQIIPGLWNIGILDNFNVTTKQFQAGWEGGKKTRIGSQQYFLASTPNGEFTCTLLGSQSNIALSSSIVRSRPDQSLGLNDTASSQSAIWHRIQKSVIGDTVQLQMSLSPDQMQNYSIATSSWMLYSIILDLYPNSRVLS